MTLDMYNVYFFGQLKLVYKMKAFVLRMIRPFLKDPNVTDEVLIQQMSMASSAEKERDKKLKTNNR